MYSADGRTLIQYPKGYGITKYNISSKVTVISESAFRGCTQLTSVNIPESVTRIENEAFCRCKRLACIKIPPNVWYIGDFAFMNCRRLAYAEIPISVPHIGKHAFHAYYWPLICGKAGSEAERYAKEELHKFHEYANTVLSREEL